MPKRKKPSCEGASITSKQENDVQQVTNAFAHKGWGHRGESFIQSVSSNEIEDWVDQPTISSIPSSQSISQAIVEDDNAIEEDNMEICSLSPAHPPKYGNITNKSCQSNISVVGHLNEVEVDEDSEDLAEEAARISDVASNCSNLFSIPVDINADSNISEQSINVPSSPNVLSEEICLLSPSYHSEVEHGLEAILQDHETASISSDSESPNMRHILKGTKWLQTVVPKRAGPIKTENEENYDSEVGLLPKDAFKKISMIKGGLAEKLELVLSKQKGDVLQKKAVATKSLGSLQIRVLNMRPYCNTFVLADCEKINCNSTEEIAIADLDGSVGDTFGLLLRNRTVQRMTICNGCCLRITPPWQMLHVPTLDKSFILCPSIKSVNLVPDMERPVKCSTIITWTCDCRQGKSGCRKQPCCISNVIRHVTDSSGDPESDANHDDLANDRPMSCKLLKYSYFTFNLTFTTKLL